MTTRKELKELAKEINLKYGLNIKMDSNGLAVEIPYVHPGYKNDQNEWLYGRTNTDTYNLLKAFEFGLLVGRGEAVPVKEK